VGLNYGLVGITILIVLGGLIALLLVLLAFQRARNVTRFGHAGRSRNLILAQISQLFIVAGVLSAVILWFTSQKYPYYIPAGLLGLGVILTPFIKLYQLKNKRNLEEKVDRHMQIAWPWRTKWALLIPFIIALVAGTLIYQAIALRQNRQAFQEARSDIDTIYADIVIQVGKPDNFRRTNSCSRPSQEFEQGPLSCDVSTDFIYGVDNKTQADVLKSQIQHVINQHRDLLSPSAPPVSDIYPILAPGNNTDSSNNYFLTKKNMQCGTKYTYDLPREIGIDLQKNDKKIFGIAFDCSSLARKDYF